MSTWKRLTRNDLRTFDEDQTKAVLYAMEHGGVGRLSSNGHAIIRNDQGQTMSVSRSSRGRRKVNVASDLCRLFGAPDSSEANGSSTALTARMLREEARASTALDGETHAVDAEPTLECPAKDCDAVFVTEGARYSHIEQRHHKCTHPGCDYVSPGTDRRGLVAHQRIAHGGFRPRAKVNAGKRTAKKTTTTPTTKTTTTPAPPAPVRPVKDAETLHAIRELLGADPRIAVLEARVEELVRERDDAVAQLALVREALHLDA